MLKNIREIMNGATELSLVHLWSGRLSEAEAAAIRSRAKADSRYREQYLGTLDALAGMEELAGDADIEAVARDPRGLSQARGRKRRATFGIAASLLVGAGLATFYFTFWNGPDPSHLERHFTRVGEQKTIDLRDGSAITLNTGTQLVVDFTEQSRTILLERGETYFQVAEDPARPFTVELGVRSLTAIGTTFNVRKHPEHYQLAVFEGTVAVHPLTDEAIGAAPLVASAGQTAVIDAPGQRRGEEGWVVEFDVNRNQLRAFQPESMERYGRWRSGMLRFHREPLYQVVQELNRYTRKKILIEDAAVMEMSVYAAVNVKELDSALNALEQLLPIEITKHYDRIVITGSESTTPARGAGS